MKIRNLVITSTFFITTIILAQEKSVEKSIYGVQVGLVGVLAHNESRLSNSIALRSEIGLGGTLLYSATYDNGAFYLIPTLIAEPRYYYNLNKRVEENKSIQKNSANFIALSINYSPNWFVISNENFKPYSTISFAPKWGIKRTLNNHFTYEAGLGIGIIHYFTDKENYSFIGSETTIGIDLQVRIGYTF